MVGRAGILPTQGADPATPSLMLRSSVGMIAPPGGETVRQTCRARGFLCAGVKVEIVVVGQLSFVSRLLAYARLLYFLGIYIFFICYTSKKTSRISPFITLTSNHLDLHLRFRFLRTIFHYH